MNTKQTPLTEAQQQILAEIPKVPMESIGGMISQYYREQAISADEDSDFNYHLNTIHSMASFLHERLVYWKSTAEYYRRKAIELGLDESIRAAVPQLQTPSAPQPASPPLNEP